MVGWLVDWRFKWWLQPSWRMDSNSVEHLPNLTGGSSSHVPRLPRGRKTRKTYHLRSGSLIKFIDQTWSSINIHHWPTVSSSGLPSGELTFCHGKSPFLMGKSTINGHVPLLFVCSPEGIHLGASKVHRITAAFVALFTGLWSFVVNGHFRNLNWRYLPCIRPI